MHGSHLGGWEGLSLPMFDLVIASFVDRFSLLRFLYIFLLLDIFVNRPPSFVSLLHSLYETKRMISRDRMHIP